MSEKTDDIIELKINCLTWLKETEDLFDFETSNTCENEHIITNFDRDHFIIKEKVDSEEKEKIEFINMPNIIRPKLKTDEATKVLGMIKYNKLKSNITIINSFKARKLNNYKKLYKPEHCERLYELFPLDEFININEGDIIKLGKIRIKFDKISFKSKNKSLYEIIQQEAQKDLGQEPLLQNNFHDNFDSNNATTNKIMITSLGNSTSIINNEIKSKIICRLCYLNESTIDDPLISPCNCSGTMKYIHLSCLKKSIKLKYSKKSNDHLEMFLFQNYNCEICLTPYPKYIVYKTQVYFLIDIDFNKFENYVLCDLSKYTENNKNKQLTHFGYIMFKIEDNKELTLGRKKNNNIKLKDISVSRNHCIIMKKDNDLLIKDLGSKFGTMKYIKDSLELKLQEQKILLFGKHQMEFCLDKSWSLFGISGVFNFMCCSCKQPINENAELIITKQTNNNNNENDIIEDAGNEEITDKILIKKIEYLNKFKDNDSYNDYIIKLDTIFKDNSLIEKNNEDNDENENEILNSQIKDKDESFTNY